MYNLIKSEFYKLRCGKTYKGLIIFTLFCVLCVVIQAFNAEIVDLKLIYTFINDRAYGFTANTFADPSNLKGVEYYTSSLVYIPLIMVGLIYLVSALTCEEYTNGTYKNTLTYGQNRTNVYISKLITISIGITIVLFILNFFSLIVGTIINGWGIEFKFETVVGMIKSTSVISIVFISISSMFMLLATIIKNKALLVTISIVALVSPVFMIESGISIDILNRYPMFMLYDICSEMPSISTINNIILNCTIITIVCIVLGSYIFKNQDIK